MNNLKEISIRIYKNIKGFLRKGRYPILFLLFLSIAFITVLYLKNNSRELILALSTEALVFVTIYYAIQTHELVTEQKIQRDIEFLMRSKHEFYGPIQERLDTIKNDISQSGILFDEIAPKFSELYYFLIENCHMVSSSTAKKIFNIGFLLSMHKSILMEQSLEKIKAELKALDLILRDERSNIDSKIRGHFSFLKSAIKAII